MDYVLIISAFVVLIIGLIGDIIPGIPGTPVSYLALLLLHWTDRISYSPQFLVITGFICVIITVLDYVVPVWGTKKFGGTKACRPVILYLNGQYHGIYFLRERYDTFRFAQELGGVSKDSVNVLRAYGRVDNGSSEAYTDLLSYCRSHDMTTDASLAYVSEKIDIYSLIDWVVCRSYMDDGDITNIRFYMSEEADGKWRWCYFDLDWAFWHNHTDLIEMIVETGPNSTLLTYLMQNPAFRDMFLRRYAELMGTILNETVIMERIDRFVSMMEPEIAQNQERYGMTVERWYNWLEELRKIIRDGNRSLTVLWNIKYYFELSDTEMADYFGELGFDLTVLDTLPTATPAPDATPSPEPAATPEAT